MVENAADDLRPNPLSLIRLIDDHIPDRCAIDKVGEHSAEPDETIPVPGTEGQIGMAEHFLGVIERSALGPWGLVEQPEKLRRVRGFIMGVGDGGLEGLRHLILEYPSQYFAVYEETDVYASPKLPKVLPTHVAETG